MTGARSLAEALGDYQRERDASALPIYEFTANLATLEPPPPEMQELLAAAADDETASNDFVSVVAGSVSPAEFLDPDHVAGILARSGRTVPG